jgi:membrane associated rhomboid family serine protease
MFVPLYDDNPYDKLFYPYVTRALVFINALVFVFFQLPVFTDDPEAVVVNFAIIPAFSGFGLDGTEVAIPFPVTFLTYMFLHGGWMHLIGNMLFLWVFGDNVEHAMGRMRFLFFYLACGAAGGFAHFLSAPDSTAPLIGASAAIAGTVAAYLMLFPNVKIWILFQFVNLVVSTDAQTAWGAHIGGLIAGAILVVFLRRPDVPLFAKDVRVITDVR